MFLFSDHLLRNTKLGSILASTQDFMVIGCIPDITPAPDRGKIFCRHHPLIFYTGANYKCADPVGKPCYFFTFDYVFNLLQVCSPGPSHKKKSLHSYLTLCFTTKGHRNVKVKKDVKEPLKYLDLLLLS